MTKIAVAMALALLFSGTPKAAPPALYTDGVYQGAAHGHFGEVRLQVKVSGGRITDIETLSCKETPGLYAAVEESLFPAILKAQSLDVDCVSGATDSSKAVQKAVKKALGL